MNRGILPSLFALALGPAVMLGCATSPGEGAADADAQAAAQAPQAPAPAQPPPSMLFVADDYDTVFDAAVRELRDCGFRIARHDRRFGVLTTYPEESPTMFEPWIGHNTTGDLARRSTLNHLRRSVAVEILLADGAAGEAGADFVLTVAVTLERQQQPSRYLMHSARGTIAANYREVPARLARQGLAPAYWEPAGEDPQLAQRLLGMIRQRAGLSFTPQYDDEMDETIED